MRHRPRQKGRRSWHSLAAFACLLGACTTPMEQGERRYGEGDRLRALEIWRSIPEDSAQHELAAERIQVVEAEFQKLVVQYKKRGRYYEDKGRLAESVLNYRLALKLQPGDTETLEHVQQLARELADRKARLQRDYRVALGASDLPAARRKLVELRSLDPFDYELESDERELDTALRAEIDRQMGAGRQGFAAGNYGASTRAFRAVLALDPNNSSARGYLSYIATIRRESDESGKRPAAFEAPATFASDAEIRAEGFYQNALASERGGDYYAAIRHDLRAVRADPEHRAARQHLALLRRRMAPEVGALVEAGRTAFRSEDLQSALDFWRQALLVDPGNDRVIAYIGRAEQQLQNLERLRSDPSPGS